MTKLTRQERRILSLLERDYDNRAIARELTIEVGSVKVHLVNIYRKLGVHDRDEAVAVAKEQVSA